MSWLTVLISRAPWTKGQHFVWHMGAVWRSGRKGCKAEGGCGVKVDADDDGNGGDDAADALRYLVATKGREIVVRKLRGL
jgi:hypothetical protein